MEKGRTKKRKAPRGRIDRLRDTKPDGEEVMAENEKDKTEILGNFFGRLFGDANSSRTVPSWIYTVWRLEELTKFRRID